MIRRQIQNTDLADDSHLAWNAFVDLLAMTDYEELSPIRKSAYLVFSMMRRFRMVGIFNIF